MLQSYIGIQSDCTYSQLFVGIVYFATAFVCESKGSFLLSINLAHGKAVYCLTTTVADLLWGTSRTTK